MRDHSKGTSNSNPFANAANYNLQVAHFKSWLPKVLKEARTQILLTYALLMAGVTAISVPLFMALFLNNVEQRVRKELYEEMQKVQFAYESWKTGPKRNVDLNTDLKAFADQILGSIEPEDDNSLIFYVDGEYYMSNPRKLPSELAQNSTAATNWSNLTELIEGQLNSANPEINRIIYLAQPLIIDGKQRGVFVAAHTTGGERQEALDGIIIFIPIVTGVFVIGSALAWLITGKLFKPVRELSTTARSISETDLSQRLAVNGSGELVELAATFNNMMDRLQNAFLSQRNFINDAGHELRTPITIIQGHLDLLDEIPPAMTETLDIVQDELERMARLVNDMIILAKAEHLDFLQLETIEIAPFLEELLLKAQTLADRDWRLNQYGQGVLVADRQRLTAALLNLLNNAAQHTQPHDQIELGAAVRKRQVRFWVRDSGEGIPLTEQARIFERFARVVSSRRQSEGSGLGLAIVQAIVEAHGGQVELASKPGRGSTFTLIFPLDSPKERLSHDAYLNR